MINKLSVIFILLTAVSCGQQETNHMVSKIYSDTLNLKNINVTVKIDSLNSGITLNLKEIKELQDSIQISFDGGFNKDSVILIHNQKHLYQDKLETEWSTGFASYVKFRRDKKKNKFDLRINGKRYVFTENNNYNFIHIDYYKELDVVFTNKGYIYD